MLPTEKLPILLAAQREYLRLDDLARVEIERGQKTYQRIFDQGVQVVENKLILPLALFNSLKQQCQQHSNSDRNEGDFALAFPVVRRVKGKGQDQKHLFYQSSIRCEESRLETVYTTLVQEVQDKLTLQDPRAIDQRIALEILRASPQPEEDLNALNFSSQIQSIRSIPGEKDQNQVYLDEIIESARGIHQRSQVLEALKSWKVAATTLQRPYTGEIAGIVEDFKQGELFSNEVKEAVREDLAIYQSNLAALKNWYLNAQKLGKSADYLQTVQRITDQFQSGVPLSEHQSHCLESDQKAAGQLSKQQNQLQL